MHHDVVDSNAIVFRGDDVSEYADTSIGVRMSLEAEGIDEGDLLGWYVRVTGVARDVVDPAELARLRELVVEPVGAALKSHWIQLRPETISAGGVPPRVTAPPPTRRRAGLLKAHGHCRAADHRSDGYRYPAG